jgi:3'(2'), 5'-bisphosphate nucleotidase
LLVFRLGLNSATHWARIPVGDFSAQAVVNTILARAFPGDEIVGEEDAKDLRGESGAELRRRVVELANESLTADLSLGDMPEWGLGPGKTWTEEELLSAIDRGTSAGGPTGREQRRTLLSSARSWTHARRAGFWCLDPIDGTKGFLRGEQYAVCLALVVDSQVQLGVIGCPNLPQDPKQPDGARGALFVAVRGQGAQQVSQDIKNSLLFGISRIFF